MHLTAEEHYTRALQLLSDLELETDIGLCISAARVHAELAIFRLAVERGCSLEQVTRYAECLSSNPPGSELHEIGDELRAMVGES